VAVAYATIEQSAADTTAATAAAEDVMSTNLKLPLDAETRPVQPGAGIPAGLAAAVENFKSAMLAVDRLIADSSTTDAEIQNHVGEACAVVTDQLRKHIEVNRPLENRVGAFVFHETYPYFGLSKIVDRCFVKPRGYAGDFLTLQMLYDDDPGSDRRLGRYIDRWVLDVPAARAVKNRRPLTRGIILDLARANCGPPTRITSLASGPARELFDLLGDDDRPDLRVTCVDIDNEALSYTQNIAHRTGVTNSMSFVQANVVRLALRRETMQLRNQDLVYSVGLIDYLRDDLVVKLLDWIYDLLRPGGTAMVGNFDVGNPNKTFMDHMLDWKLFHRSAQDLVNLFARSKFGAVPVEVRFESTGINLFALATRTR
jgi:extracellular factor (EF) 3-hydroxypalmitic acid methyl ester biosynthesis protein